MAHSWCTDVPHSLSPPNKLRWNMVIKKREKADGCPLLGDTWTLCKAFTKHQVLSTSEQTQPVSTPLHLQNLNKKKETRPMRSLQMQYLNVTLLCEAGKKKTTKFHSHTGTKGSRHQKYHSYWMGLSSLQKSDVLEHLEKKKSSCAIKNKSVLEAMGDLPCFVFVFTLYRISKKTN